MQTIGVLLLAAATAGDGFGYAKPGVGLKKWLRPHAVVSGAPAGGPQFTAATMGGPSAPDAGGAGRRFMNTKSQIYFLDPDRMNITWQTGVGPNGERTYLPTQLVVPARYNFNQGYVYRLKLTNIPGRPGATLYPTVEVAPTTPLTDAYLAHNAIPVQFTSEDFDQVVDGGNFVTKVIYLPDPKYQELAVSAETLVNTRLEPGVDPVIEADKRGTILLIVRLGAIDLEMPGPGVAGGVLSGPVVGGAVSGAPIVSGPINGVVTGTPIGGIPLNGSVVGAPIEGTIIGSPAPVGTAAPVGAPVSELPPANLPAGVSNLPAPAPVIDSVPVDSAPASPAPTLDAKPNVPAAPKPGAVTAPKPSGVVPPVPGLVPTVRP